MNVTQKPLKESVKQKQQKLQEPLKPANAQYQPLQEEGLYQQVKQDEQLRSYHVEKLLSTPGYGHLTEETASDMVEQMLRLSCLMYELVMEETKQQQFVEAPIQGKNLGPKNKRNNRGSNK